ncbi:MAG: hypothetical protein A3F90_10215 [Deltaproteobacteria bacterium RIFCSPLOWO2_12_FULL_60_19]|nr:MAG: hypothetical protein A3F90_10215 [Deltaproteobacteria bacterium RIFCSPLOWO2_12_FULL_60_19]
MDLREIRQLVRQGDYEFSVHAQQERLEDNLDITEIESALLGNAEILEEYPNDPRGESCLVLGFTESRPAHVVLGWAKRKLDGSKRLRIITVYIPRLPKWANPRTRGITI